MVLRSMVLRILRDFLEFTAAMHNPLLVRVTIFATLTCTSPGEFSLIQLLLVTRAG
jgi:hypothetical protein